MPKLNGVQVAGFTVAETVIAPGLATAGLATGGGVILAAATVVAGTANCTALLASGKYTLVKSSTAIAGIHIVGRGRAVTPEAVVRSTIKHLGPPRLMQRGPHIYYSIAQIQVIVNILYLLLSYK